MLLGCTSPLKICMTCSNADVVRASFEHIVQGSGKIPINQCLWTELHVVAGMRKLTRSRAAWLLLLL